MIEIGVRKGRASLLIVDDSIEQCSLLSDELTANYDISIANSATEAIEATLKRSFDIILLDFNMPGINGLDVCRIVREELHHKKTLIFFLSAEFDSKTHEEAYTLGADYFITKPYQLNELKLLLENSLKRVGFESNYQFVDLRLDSLQFQAYRGSENLGLTPKEFQILNLLSTYPGRIYNRQEMLKIIWGDVNVGERTIDTSISSLRKKIKSSSQIVIEKHYSQGYSLRVA